jgi:hypothetical protein
MLIVVGLALLALILGVHGWALRGGWRLDDVGQLIAAENIAWWRLLADPGAWKTFNPFFFTPGLAFAYKLDQWLFGRVPAAHYAHVLASLWMLSWLTFAFLRRHAGAAWAAWGCALFVLSAPVAATVQFIPARHYIEGLIFTLLAIHCHLRGARSGRPLWFAAAALSYLLAALFKEVYAPMVLLLSAWCLSLDRRWRERLALIGLYAGIALTYFLWRGAMLERLVGGYRELRGPGELWNSVGRLPWTILGGPELDSVLALLLLAISFGWVAVRNHRAAWGGAICLVALSAPMAAMPFVSSSPGIAWFNYRFYVLPVWAICTGGAWALSRLHGRGRFLAIATAVLLTTATVRYTARLVLSLREQTATYDEQVRFVETHSGDALLVTRDPVTVQWIGVHTKLRTGGPEHPAPEVIIKQSQLTRALARHQRVWAYDPGCRCIALASEALLQRNRGLYLAYTRARENELGPLALSLNLHLEDHVATWKISPARGEVDFESPQGFFVNIPKAAWAAFSPQPENAWIVLYRTDLAGHEMETERIQVPSQGTLVWHIGVFVDKTLAPGFEAKAQEGSSCGVEMPERLDRRRPTPIRAWLSGSERRDRMARDVAVTLSQEGETKYVAFLYRESGPAPGRAELSVLDADLTGVSPGDYAIDLLRRDSGRLLRCRTGRSVHVF